MPRKPVWHCSVRTHPDDPIMTDQQWRGIARQVVAKVGLAPDGDEKAVRWVAMRWRAGGSQTERSAAADGLLKLAPRIAVDQALVREAKKLRAETKVPVADPE